MSSLDLGGWTEVETEKPTSSEFSLDGWTEVGAPTGDDSDTTL